MCRRVWLLRVVLILAVWLIICVYYVFWIYDIDHGPIIPSTHVDVVNPVSRILIVGYGHSGTTFIQQFIGDVIFNGYENVFYLFEPTHHQHDDMFLNYYNKNSIYHDVDFSNMNNVRSLAFIDFFQCNFNALRANQSDFYHNEKNKRLNKLRQQNVADMSELETYCSSKQTLIYKDIFYHNFAESYKYLINYYSNSLKIIALVRNPMTHIPSSIGLGPSKGLATKHICEIQLMDIQYATENWKYPMFTLMKMEHFFWNISHSFDTVIKYFYTTLRNDQIYNDDFNVINFTHKYEEMKIRALQVGKPNPFKNELGDAFKQYIKDNCSNIASLLTYSFDTQT